MLAQMILSSALTVYVEFYKRTSLYGISTKVYQNLVIFQSITRAMPILKKNEIAECPRLGHSRFFLIFIFKNLSDNRIRLARAVTLF